MLIATDLEDLVNYVELNESFNFGANLEKIQKW